MNRTLVTGATGTLGTALRSRLTGEGHAVRAASSSPPDVDAGNVEWVELDVTDDVDLEPVLEDVDVVIHTATAPQGNTEAVDVQGTERLLEAAGNCGVDNFLFPSIVGIDDIPFAYYRHKLVAEAAVERSEVPTTIVRATQFYSFVDEMLGYVAKLPVWPLPTKMQVQPVDVGAVADVVVKYATPTASGRTDPVCGPEIHTLRGLAEAYRDACGLRRPIIRFPIPSKTVTAFRKGYATRPEYMGGKLTWEEWLAERYANGPS